jgi:Endoglucanase
MKYKINKKLPDFSTGMRGAMVVDTYEDENLRILKSWGANLIRWRMYNCTYVTVLDRINALQQTLDFCLENGMKVIVVLMKKIDDNVQNVVTERYRDGERKDEYKMFYDLTLYNEFLRIWRLIASNIAGHPALYAYNPINEPFFRNGSGAVKSHLDAQIDVANIIREYDSITPITIEPNIWSNPDGFNGFNPISSIGKVVYQVHFYQPFEYTHQGVWNPELQTKYSYPGIIDEKYEDKNTLRKKLEPAFQFQQNNPGVKMLVGEFSAIRWANGAAEWIDDCISLFEEYGWDWCYHAFREYSGWSVEHVGDITHDGDPRVEYDTDRKEVLLKYYKLNNRVKSTIFTKD